jgi:hypothetical protein
MKQQCFDNNKASECYAMLMDGRQLHLDEMLYSALASGGFKVA